MKRRSFLTMLSAAAVMPALPAAGVAQTAAYNRFTYGLAVFHARTHPHVSARGLAFRLKVPVVQAEAMMGEMVKNGLVRPIAGGAGVHVRAVSNILKPGIWGAPRAVRQASAAKRIASKRAMGQVQTQSMLAHLHHICHNYGLTLSPRALAQSAGAQ